MKLKLNTQGSNTEKNAGTSLAPILAITLFPNVLYFRLKAIALVRVDIY